MKTFATTMMLLFSAGLMSVGCGGNTGGTPNDAGAGGAGTGGTGSGGAGTGGTAGGTGGAGGMAGGSGGSGGGGGVSMSDGGLKDSAAGGTDGAGDGAADGAGGAPADNWDNFAKGFFETYCVSCHNDDNSGAATRNYHMMAVVVTEKVDIGCGVAKSQPAWTQRGCTGFPPARQFPVGNGPKPNDADRDRLLRWLDSGTP